MRIDTLEDAQRILSTLVSGGELDDLTDASTIEVGSWIHLTVYFPRPAASASITYPYIEAFAEIQRQFYQFAALVETGISNAGYLSEEHKREFDALIFVTGGSTEIKADFTPGITAFLKSAGDKLSAKTIAIIIVGLGIAATAGWAFSSYLEKEKEVKLAEIKSAEHKATLEALSFANESQLKLFEQMFELLRSNGEVGAKASSVIEKTFDSLLKAASRTNDQVINGQKLDQSTAKTVRVAPRPKSEKEIVKKKVRVTDINTEDIFNIVVVILDEDSGEQNRIKFKDSLFAEVDRAKMFEALERRVPIWLELVVMRADEGIRSVEILRVVDEPDRTGAEVRPSRALSFEVRPTFSPSA